MTTDKRRRGPRGDVSARRILAAGDALLRRDGLDGLSLRTLAREAGVTPNAIYTYFTDMTALRVALADRFLAGLDIALLDHPDPGEALAAFLRHLLDEFGRRPGYAQLIASHRIAGPGALGLNERLLTFAEDRLGHPAHRAAHVTLLITHWLHGRVQLATSDAPTAAFTEAISAADPAQYPKTLAMPDDPHGDDELALLIDLVTSHPRP